ETGLPIKWCTICLLGREMTRSTSTTNRDNNRGPGRRCPRQLGGSAPIDRTVMTVSGGALWKPCRRSGRLASPSAVEWRVHCCVVARLSPGRPESDRGVRRTQPAAYLKILALLVPREHKVEHRNPVKDMTDEQLERGIELIKEMLAQREAG